MILFTGGGACVVGGVHGREDMSGRECVWQGVCVAGAFVAGEMTTAADGTHPTGMYSCLNN